MLTIPTNQNHLLQKRVSVYEPLNPIKSDLKRAQNMSPEAGTLGHISLISFPHTYSNMTRLCPRISLVNRRGKTEHNLMASFTKVGDNPTSFFKSHITKNMHYKSLSKQNKI